MPPRWDWDHPLHWPAMPVKWSQPKRTIRYCSSGTTLPWPIPAMAKCAATFCGTFTISWAFPTERIPREPTVLCRHKNPSPGPTPTLPCGGATRLHNKWKTATPTNSHPSGISGTTTMSAKIVCASTFLHQDTATAKNAPSSCGCTAAGFGMAMPLSTKATKEKTWLGSEMWFFAPSTTAWGRLVLPTFLA